jgi:O-antigen/teichoic acid export membrane protein
LLLTIFFVLSGRTFFNLIFGHEYAAAYVPLLILLVGQMVNSAAGLVGLLLNMTGHENETAIRMAVAAVISITLNLLLIPIWGIQGAATAEALSMIIWNILLWRVVRRRLGINSFAFPLGRKHN